jgi:hypothetical protein
MSSNIWNLLKLYACRHTHTHTHTYHAMPCHVLSSFIWNYIHLIFCLFILFVLERGKLPWSTHWVSSKVPCVQGLVPSLVLLVGCRNCGTYFEVLGHWRCTFEGHCVTLVSSPCASQPWGEQLYFFMCSLPWCVCCLVTNQKQQDHMIMDWNLQDNEPKQPCSLYKVIISAFVTVAESWNTSAWFSILLLLYLHYLD